MTSISGSLSTSSLILPPIASALDVPVLQKATSKIQKKYPSFGEKIRGPKPPHWIRVASKVCLVAACCLSVIGIIPLLIYAVRKMACKYQLKHSLPEGTERKEETGDGPRVGKYYEARVCIAKTADEGFLWKQELIRSAETSIELSVNYGGGGEFQTVLSLIEERLSAKGALRAHLLLNPEMLEKEDTQRLEALHKKYQDRFTFLIHSPRIHFKGGIHTEENHVKMLVVDEKYFVTGGTSIHPKLSRETNTNSDDVKALRAPMSHTLATLYRDNDIAGESEPIAKVMRSQFYKLFQICEMHECNKPAAHRFFACEGQKGQCAAFDRSNPVPGVRMKVLVGGPEHRFHNPITEQYAKRIKKARQSIVLANMQFYPHRDIRSAISQKKQEHVPITLVTGGTADTSCFGGRCQVWRSRVRYDLPDEVYEYQAPHQLYHKKIALFDSQHTVIGSYNLGRKSSLYDHEMICVLKDERITGLFKDIIEEDKRRSFEVRSNILKHHLGHRLLGGLLRIFEQFI